MAHRENQTRCATLHLMTLNMYINEEGEYDLKLYNHIEVDIDISIGGEGEKDSLDEVRYRGEEAKHFIDSLIAHLLERKIIFHKKNIEVE